MKNSQHNIYIVDDDASVRRSISRLIRSVDMPALTYASSEEFLEAVPLESNGFLILDMIMPGMSGFELQEKLYAEKSPLRIIFISACQKPGDREQALKRGAKGFLSKPFSDDELLSLITGCAEESR